MHSIPEKKEWIRKKGGQMWWDELLGWPLWVFNCNGLCDLKGSSSQRLYQLFHIMTVNLWDEERKKSISLYLSYIKSLLTVSCIYFPYNFRLPMWEHHVDQLVNSKGKALGWKKGGMAKPEKIPMPPQQLS